ncbi:PEP carboxykinase-like protein [Ascoidea rubescens DSM 1968]|uniref:PEP carboxykinase-like protein n=1 Tax=Ascoidea rubescens DSM 1968 TaxID=1344418 RepID=A0A1D2VJ67_9ASCO|nr:PEP carboxykinase-like protein [Ascoidea rubescens DSM 1968]ODV61655.1 PEP carboxykinase-like protein [Ascoidea rubescens DSM 1968]
MFHKLSNLTFKWENICVSVPGKDNSNGDISILTKNQGSVRSRQMMAIMGPSGSGKTTLLNVLAQRGVPPKGKQQGVVTAGDMVVTLKNIRQFSSYVEQEDSLIGSLTVKETIDFAAKLSESSNGALGNFEDRNGRVNELLEYLGLMNQKSTKVGTPLQKGISGGQKRRVSVASQVITEPSVLFLDEPTSGLDSTASYEVISTIKTLAKAMNIVVIVSIHQPSTSTFNLFDKVMFLSKGLTVYSGEVGKVVSYFKSVAGYEIPEFYNPAEYILELINTDFHKKSGSGSEQDEDGKKDIVNKLRNIWEDYGHKTIEQMVEFEECGSDGECPEALFQEPCKSVRSCVLINVKQTYYLMQRLFIKSRRDVLAYYVRIVMYLGLAILMGTVWLRLGSEQENIQPFINAIFFSGAFMSFMSVAYIPAFLEDYGAYKKEHMNGLYGAFAFVVSNFMVGLPFLFIISLLFGVITYFMCNFRQSSTGFGEYVMWLFLDLVAAESMTVFVSTMFPVFVVALALTAFMNGLWMAVGGFLVSASILNDFWYYSFYWVNYQRYVFQGMMFNEFRKERVFECDDGCHCMYSSGLQEQCQIEGTAVLRSLGYGDNDKGLWVGILVALIFAYRLGTYLALKYGR